MPHFRHIENLRHVHFIKGDVKAYGAGHEKVVMLADDCAVCAVLLPLIGQELVEDLTVSLSVKMIADTLYESGYYHRLCGGIGVKAIFPGNALTNLVLGLTASVEAGIYVGNLIEDILRLVASLNLPLPVVCLQCV